MILLLILLIILVGMVFYQNNETTICNKRLTDNEYLAHMITHHEVAVYMSEEHLHNTKNPIMLDSLRNLIRLQKYEINIMKQQNQDDAMINKNRNAKSSYIYALGDFTKPNAPYLSNTFCDPGFFNMSHNEKLHNMTDAMYIKHMIPHHQVAIDMSKKILETTNNNFIIDLAYKIIRDQQSESIKLYSLSKSNNWFKSNIV